MSGGGARCARWNWVLWRCQNDDGESEALMLTTCTGQYHVRYLETWGGPHPRAYENGCGAIIPHCRATA